MYSELDNWIRENWHLGIRSQPEDEVSDREGALLGLPYPYTVPSPGHVLCEMYYWDTYFTNLGLIAHGRMDQVENNIRNLLFMVRKYGKVLNGNMRRYLSRSQPPLLTPMVIDYRDAGGDLDLVDESLDLLIQEHDNYWEQPPHLTQVGLNRYYDSKEEPHTEYYSPDVPGVTLTPEDMAVCESGWDMNPRTAGCGRSIIPVELNAILYRNELSIASLLGDAGRDEDASRFTFRADERRELILELMRGEDGYFYDWDIRTESRISVFSAAPCSLLWAGALSQEEADELVPLLLRLETDWGIVTCLHDYGYSGMQWNWPMGWPPVQWWVVKGLLNYGYEDDAKRIARKYLELVYRNWKDSGNLWEKYNVVDGNLDCVNDRYVMPTHMGWTAGVYAAFFQLFGND